MTFRAPTKICLFGLVLLLSPAALADDPSWSLTFGTTGDEALHHVEPLADGGFVVAGEMGSLGVAARFDSAGGTLWTKIYDAGPLGEIRPAPAGGFIAAGHAGNLIYVIKLDDDGGPEWQHTHGFSRSLSSATIQPSAGGGYFVGAGRGDKPAVVKLDSNGVFVWRREIGINSGTDFFSGLVPTPQGGVKMLRNDSGTPCVQEFDADGNSIRSLAFYGLGTGVMAHVLEGESLATSDGGVIGSGYAQVMNPDGMSSHDDAAIAKLGEDYSGDWFTLIGRDPLFVVARSMVERDDGGYVVAIGLHHSYGPHHGCWVVGLDADGRLVWQWRYTGKCNAIRETDDGGLLLAGHRYVVGAEQDAWVARLGPSGTLPESCDFRQPGTLATEVADVTLTNDLYTLTEKLSLAAPVSATVAIPTLEWAEQCSGEAVLGPDDEIAPRGSEAPLIFSDKRTLEWGEPAGGGVDSYNLYQGSLGDLPGSYGACLEPQIPGPPFEHNDEPQPGSTWFYLVNGNTFFGETTLGRDTDGRLRPNTSPCF